MTGQAEVVAGSMESSRHSSLSRALRISAVILLLAYAVVLFVLGHDLNVAEADLPDEDWPGFRGTLLEGAAIALVVMSVIVYRVPLISGVVLLVVGIALVKWLIGDAWDCSGSCWQTSNPWTWGVDAEEVTGLGGLVVENRLLTLALFVPLPTAGVLLFVGGMLLPLNRLRSSGTGVPSASP